MRSTVLADQSGSSEIILQTCKGTALEIIFEEYLQGGSKQLGEATLTQVSEHGFRSPEEKELTRREAAEDVV